MTATSPLAIEGRTLARCSSLPSRASAYADRVRGDERAGLEETPALLGDDGRVGHTVLRHRAPAELLGDQHREPAELRGLAPVVGAGAGALVGERTDPRERARRLDEARRGLAHQLLIVAQIEIHISLRVGIVSDTGWIVSHGSEARHCVGVADAFEHDLHPVADLDALGIAVDDVRDHAGTRTLGAVDLDHAGHVRNRVREVG